MGSAELNIFELQTQLNQLREILFPNFKTRDECFNEDIEYNKEEHQLQDEKLSEETLEFVRVHFSAASLQEAPGVPADVDVEEDVFGYGDDMGCSAYYEQS